MLNIIHIDDTYRNRLNDLLREEWGSLEMVSRGRIFNIGGLPGFIALYQGELVGAVTFEIAKRGNHSECEITSLNSFKQNKGVGTRLIDEVVKYALSFPCQRIWLITTNDNINAIRFYQKKGFRITNIYVGAIEESRKLKPEIPRIGMNNIPIRDEIEFEFIF